MNSHVRWDILISRNVWFIPERSKTQQRLTTRPVHSTFPFHPSYRILTRFSHLDPGPESEERPWTGDEHPHDAILRMLVDKHQPNKPLRVEGAARQNIPRPRAD